MVMKNPFRKREIKPIPIQLTPLTVTHTVKHEYGVKPRPVSAYITVTNKNGERWVAPSFNIYPGMADIRFNSFPLQFITGRDDDMREMPVDIRLTIEFERP